MKLETYSLNLVQRRSIHTCPAENHGMTKSAWLRKEPKMCMKALEGASMKEEPKVDWTLKMR